MPKLEQTIHFELAGADMLNEVGPMLNGFAKAARKSQTEAELFLQDALAQTLEENRDYFRLDETNTIKRVMTLSFMAAAMRDFLEEDFVGERDQHRGDNYKHTNFTENEILAMQTMAMDMLLCSDIGDKKNNDFIKGFTPRSLVKSFTSAAGRGYQDGEAVLRETIKSVLKTNQQWLHDEMPARVRPAVVLSYITMALRGNLENNYVGKRDEHRGESYAHTNFTEDEIYALQSLAMETILKPEDFLPQ